MILSTYQKHVEEFDYSVSKNLKEFLIYAFLLKACLSLPTLVASSLQV